LLVLVTTSYYTPLWALWAAAGASVLRALDEMGYLHSERLGKHLANYREHSPAHVEDSTQVSSD